MKDLKLKGVVCVADRSELEVKTSEGWKVVAMYKETSTSFMSGRSGQKDQYGGDTYMDIPTSRDEIFFVLEKGQDTVFAQLTKELEAEKAKVKSLGKLVEDFKTEVSRAEDNARTYDEFYKEARAQRDAFKEKIQDLLATKQLMESHLGQVRTVLGSQRMDEILEGVK